MKNFLVYVMGTRGDIQPFIGLGYFLKKKNINLIFLTLSEHKDFIVKHGFESYTLNLKFLREKKKKNKEEIELIDNIINFNDNRTVFFRITQESHHFAVSMQSHLKNLYHNVGNYTKKMFKNSVHIIDFLKKKYNLEMILIHNHDFNIVSLVAMVLKIKFINFCFFPNLVPTDKYPHPFVCCNDSLPYPWNFLNNSKTWSYIYNLFSLAFNSTYQNIIENKTEFTIKPTFFENFNNFKLEPVVNVFSTHIFPKLKISKKSHILETGFLFMKSKKNSKIDSNTLKFINSGKRKNQSIIFFGLGSMMVPKKKCIEIFEELCEILEHNQNFKIILANYIAKEISKMEKNIPDNLLLLTHGLPYNILFKKMDLVICHGGMGTLSTAIICKAPLLIIPISYDQYFNGMIIKEKKIGDYLLIEDIYKLNFKILDIIKNKKIKKKIEKTAELIKNEKSYEKLWKFIKKMNSSTYYDNLQDKYLQKKK